MMCQTDNYTDEKHLIFFMISKTASKRKFDIDLYVFVWFTTQVVYVTLMILGCTISIVASDLATARSYTVTRIYSKQNVFPILNNVHKVRSLS